MTLFCHLYLWTMVNLNETVFERVTTVGIWCSFPFSLRTYQVVPERKKDRTLACKETLLIITSPERLGKPVQLRDLQLKTLKLPKQPLKCTLLSHTSFSYFSFFSKFFFMDWSLRLSILIFEENFTNMYQLNLT